MKTDEELNKLIDSVFPNYSTTKKRKLAKLLSVENRLESLEDMLSIQNDMLDKLEPLAISEADKKKGSKSSREFKQRILEEALKQIFSKYPNTEKTLGNVWNKFSTIKKKKIYDPLTGEGVTISLEKNVMFINRVDTSKKRLKYSKRSIQPFIDLFK